MNGTQERPTSGGVQNANQFIGIGKKQKLTQKRLKELLDYNPMTGIFKWKTYRAGKVSPGDIAGTKNHPHGYVYIRINKKNYKAARLAWLYMNGYFPEHCVDHIDRDRKNDKWGNLRHVTQSCNVKNSSPKNTNTSGVTGVSFSKNRNKWVAQITVKYKNISLGRFKKIEDAAMARWEAEKKYSLNKCATDSSAYNFLTKNKLIL